MKGYWLNSCTGEYRAVVDHALDLQMRGWSERHGFVREDLLLAAMEEGFIRVRQHRFFVTFEYTVPSVKACESIVAFMNETRLYQRADRLRFNNLRTGRTVEASWKELGRKI